MTNSAFQSASSNDGATTIVGIVGAGTQGSMIAFRSALWGKRVRIFDMSGPQLDRAATKITGWLAEFVAEGLISSEQRDAILAKVQYCSRLSDCLVGADVAVEAVPENLDLKRAVHAQIDSLIPSHCLIASSTSSLVGSDIFRDVACKDRAFNVNFSFPVREHNVEVMWNPYTSAETIAAAKTFLGSLGLVILETRKEIQGYAFNRTWRVIKKEVLMLVDQGFCDFQDLDRAFIMVLGCGRGPFQLMDQVGLDVVRDIEMSYYAKSHDESDKPPKLVEDMVAQGRLGAKVGKGFYEYPNPAFEKPGWLNKEGEFAQS